MKGLKKILLMLMLALPLAAAGVYLFKTLDIKDGLTSSQINCILKDSRGYMWLGFLFARQLYQEHSGVTGWQLVDSDVSRLLCLSPSDRDLRARHEASARSNGH